MKALWLSALFLGCLAVASAKDSACALTRGVDAYRAGLYAEALETFVVARELGIRDGRLEYNIGNCWWRLQEPARALAAWQRARAFLPRDPEVNANLRMAARHLGLEEQGARVPFLASLAELLGAFTLRELVSLAVGACGALFGCLILHALSGRALALWLAGLSALLVLLWGGQALQRAADRRVPAVVVAAEVALRAEPREELPALATLRAGVDLRLLGREGAWALVRAQEHRGWLPTGAIEPTGLDWLD